MTESEWKKEAANAVAALGLPYQLDAAWIDKRISPKCCASYVDNRNGSERAVAFLLTEFSTEATRRGEIARQLRGGVHR